MEIVFYWISLGELVLLDAQSADCTPATRAAAPVGIAHVQTWDFRCEGLCKLC